MPTIFSHGAVGFIGSKLGLHDSKADKRIITTSIVVAAVPDLDALFIGSIPYGDPLGHRGLTHSLFFATCLGLGLAFVFVKAGWSEGHSFGTLAALFGLITASHGFFDAMTNGGLGIAFFAPFNNTRYFLPWRPIPVAPLSVHRLFTASGMWLMLSEAALFGPFLAAAIIWDKPEPATWRRICALVCALAGSAVWVLTIMKSDA
jgi:inner membrane protein